MMNNKKIAFLKVMSTQGCQTVSAVEMLIHTTAKEKLIHFINEGGKVIFAATCLRCNEITATLLKEKDTAISSGTDYDIIITNVDNDITLGIKICYKLQIPLNVEEDIPWVAVPSTTIITAFEEAKDGDPILLSECRILNTCKEKFCFPLQDIAHKLGYFKVIKAYSCEARRLVDAAQTGSYTVDCADWNTAGWPEQDVKGFTAIELLWKAFLGRERCLRCGNKHDLVKYQHPFCVTCYKLTVAECEIGKVKRVTVSEDLRKGLYNSFRWLDNVPGNWEPGTLCHFCRKNYLTEKDNAGYEQLFNPGSNYVSSFIYWDGERKSCCTVCLVDRTKCSELETKSSPETREMSKPSPRKKDAPVKTTITKRRPFYPE